MRDASGAAPLSDNSTADDAESIRALVVLEQTLGHVTHGQNLQRLLPTVGGIDPTFVPVEFELDGWRSHVPGMGNWTVRAGIRARRGVRRVMDPAMPYQVALVHTQVPAVLMGSAMDSIPTVVSLDATPIQYDRLGDHYHHATGPATLERMKHALNRRCFMRSAHLVTWAEWTKQSLIDDYRIPPANITVIPPGVDTGRWFRDGRAERAREAADRPVRVLFVGGDLRRKGGHLLLEAFDRLRTELDANRVELHVVTTSALDERPGVHVYGTMKPNSAELVELYHRCDIFCLPTLGDCLPMVLPEAAAAGLTLVSTDVGAIREIVRDQQTGRLVRPGDVDMLTDILRQLIDDPDQRERLASAAVNLVQRDHDAATNAHRLAMVLRAASISEHDPAT